MKLLRTLTNNGFDEENNFVSTRNVRLGAIAICVLSEFIAAFFTGWRSFGLGLLLGGAIAQLLFRQHEISIAKIMQGKNPKSAAVSNYLIRLVVRGAAIFIAIKNPDVNVIGCVIGLLSIPYAIYALAFIDGIKNKDDGKEV